MTSPPTKQGWRKISTYTNESDDEKVNLWFDVWASPRSFGIADAWEAKNCWRENGKWFDDDGELEQRYITHWRLAS